jgi:ABC-type nitrate/sulfonate/bicarbonate transport system, permease component
MIRKCISIIGFMMVWQIVAFIVNKPIILPFPFEVITKMIEQLSDSSFYLAILYTLMRTFISFIIALILGITLGLISGLSKKCKEYILPVISILQTIPQIAYILIILFWFSSLTSMIIIVCLMLIPVFYYNTLNGIENINPELQDIILLYHQPLSYTIPKIYLPLIKSHIVSAIDTCLPLSLKIGVMAEIFVQTNYGIGSKLYLARTQIDMVSIIALTIWMIIIILIITELYRYIIFKK